VSNVCFFSEWYIKLKNVAFVHTVSLKRQILKCEQLII